MEGDRRLLIVIVIALRHAEDWLSRTYVMPAVNRAYGIPVGRDAGWKDTRGPV
jgi:hypothetical protein